MIYATGDTHSTIDWKKLNTTNFPEQKNLTKDDYVIILGDFGGVWDGSKTDDYALNTYNKRNFTTLFIDGNHENHDMLDAYPVEEWKGGKIHRIRDSVIHLMRGQVFNIDGLTFFTMGGAPSTDRAYRTEGVSWWAREMPSIQEYREAIDNLDKVDFKVDYVLTHCAPEAYVSSFMYYVKEGLCFLATPNDLGMFFTHLIVDRKLQFKGWYFGHYHGDEEKNGFHLLYDKIERIV